MNGFRMRLGLIRQYKHCRRNFLLVQFQRNQVNSCGLVLWSCRKEDSWQLHKSCLVLAYLLQFQQDDEVGIVIGREGIRARGHKSVELQHKNGAKPFQLVPILIHWALAFTSDLYILLAFGAFGHDFSMLWFFFFLFQKCQPSCPNCNGCHLKTGRQSRRNIYDNCTWNKTC